MNLVLGAAVGYNKNDLYYFIKSLRLVFDEDVYLIFNLNIDIQTEKFLEKYNIKKLFTNENPKKIFKTRYKIYHDFLQYNKKYNKILLTDTRDVIFQSNPFLNTKLLDINFFMEDKKIKNCSINSNWIRRLYGLKNYNLIKDNFISCSGTTIGSYYSVMEYLKKITLHIKNYTYISFFGSPGSDQGNHNYILNTEKFNKQHKFFNDDGVVATLSSANLKKFKFEKKLSNYSNEEFCIIHQYDRFLIKTDENNKEKKYFHELTENLLKNT